MITEVPIKFEAGGLMHSGILKVPSGAGNSVWHLMIDHFYRGQLVTTTDGWRFFSAKNNEFDHLGEFFADWITAWMDSNA